jgi:hypothetical protein
MYKSRVLAQSLIKQLEHTASQHPTYPNSHTITPQCTISIRHGSMDHFATHFSIAFDAPESETVGSIPVNADGNGNGGGCVVV